MNGTDLEFKYCRGKFKPHSIGTVETNLTLDVHMHSLSHTITSNKDRRKTKEEEGRPS